MRKQYKKLAPQVFKLQSIIMRWEEDRWELFALLPSVPALRFELMTAKVLRHPVRGGYCDLMTWLSLYIQTLQQQKAQHNEFRKGVSMVSEVATLQRVQLYLHQVMTGTLTPEEACRAGRLSQALEQAK